MRRTSQNRNDLERIRYVAAQGLTFRQRGSLAGAGSGAGSGDLSPLNAGQASRLSNASEPGSGTQRRESLGFGNIKSARIKMKSEGESGSGNLE